MSPGPGNSPNCVGRTSPDHPPPAAKGDAPSGRPGPEAGRTQRAVGGAAPMTPTTNHDPAQPWRSRVGSLQGIVAEPCIHSSFRTRRLRGRSIHAGHSVGGGARYPVRRSSLGNHGGGARLRQKGRRHVRRLPSDPSKRNRGANRPVSAPAPHRWAGPAVGDGHSGWSWRGGCRGRLLPEGGMGRWLRRPLPPVGRPRPWPRR